MGPFKYGNSWVDDEFTHTADDQTLNRRSEIQKDLREIIRSGNVHVLLQDARIEFREALPLSAMHVDFVVDLSRDFIGLKRDKTTWVDCYFKRSDLEKLFLNLNKSTAPKTKGRRKDTNFYDWHEIKGRAKKWIEQNGGMPHPKSELVKKMHGWCVERHGRDREGSRTKLYQILSEIEDEIN